MRRAVQDGRRLLHEVGGCLLRRRHRRRRGRGEVVVGGRGQRRKRGRGGGGVGPRDHRSEAVADAALAPDARVPVAADNVGVVVLEVDKKWILE